MTQTQYENYYVNKDGDVFSTQRGGIKKLKAHNLKGYLKIGIYNNCKRKMMSVHRLVAQTFIPNPDSKPEVNHKNGIKNDNRVENLEWSTHKENINHAVLNGLRSSIGETHYKSKLTEEQVLQIRQLYAHEQYKQKELAKMFDIDFRQISAIINKKTWKHI